MATQLEELQAELEIVTKAVNKAYSSAEYEIASGNSKRRLKRQDLSVLLARKSQLEVSIQRLGGTTDTSSVTHGVVVDGNSCLNA